MFNTFLVQPVYNFLVFLLNVVPFADLGIALIITTILVRTILYPISRNAIRSQIKMKQIQEPLKELQLKYKDDQHKLAAEMMKLYRENNIKPFSSFLLILIQLPVIFALYFVFLREGLPNINAEMLYSFIQAPDFVNPRMLGFVEVTSKSLILAVLAAVTQYLQFSIMMKKNSQLDDKKKKSKEPNMMEDMMKSMQMQMKYVMPAFMGFIAYSLGAVIALYFTVGNIFSIFQEIVIKNRLIKEKVDTE
jgi:YidC/Oxa1 family membrane protein insertase